MTLEKFLTLSKAVLCLSVAVSALIVTPYIVNSQLTSLRKTATIEIQDTRTQAIGLIDRRFDSLQGNVTNWLASADKRIGSLESNTFLLANNLRTDTFGLAADLRKDTFSALGDTRKDLFGRVDNLTTLTNNQLTATNTQVAKLVDVYSAIPGQVGARFNEQTDCKTNGLCWQNMTTDMLVNFRYTGRDISVASKAFSTGFPKILANVDTTTANFGAITTNFKKLTTPHWYDRALGYGLNAGLLYSRFNPATNVVVGITQAASSQK